MSNKIPIGLKMLNIYKETIDLATIELGMIHEHTDKSITFYENLIKDMKKDIIEIEYDGQNLINNDDVIPILCGSPKFTDILYDHIIADLIHNMYPDCLEGTGYKESKEEREIYAYRRIKKAMRKIKMVYFRRDKKIG